MKILTSILVFIPLLVMGEESFFFMYKKGGPGREVRVEDLELHVVTPIRKIAPLKAKSISARHQGLGPGRAYQIQVNLTAKPEGDSIPMVKLGDDVISAGIYMSRPGDGKTPESYHLQSDDPEKIQRWCQMLGTLLEIPKDRIEIDLTPLEEEDADPSEEAPKPQADDRPKDLEGDAEWKFDAIGTLSVRVKGDSTVFLLDGKEEVFRLEPPEYVKAARLSDDGKTLAFVAMKRRGGGSDFAALVRVQAVEGKLKAERILDSRTWLFEDRHWWLSDLGAISNDGTRILAEFGVEARDGRRMFYHWHTVELASGKILGEGMTIENGRTSPER